MPMMQETLNNSNYYYVLYETDKKIAEAAKAKGCPYCNGSLHQANYPRLPRGAPQGIDLKYHIGFSLCCAVEGCRKRLTPPSLRFLGRKIYTSMVLILVFRFDGNYSQKISTLNEYYPLELTLAEETVSRWQRYWRSQFPLSPFYNKQSTLLQLPIDSLPISLLTQFKGTLTTQLFNLLQYLSPLSASSHYLGDNFM
jgi:hypothetical protein